MAKTQANFPTSLDVLNTDREAGQVITSASYDVIEDAITEIEAEIRRVTPKTGTATLTEAMGGTVLVSAAGAAYTITLPTAVGNTGLTYHFIKTDANYTLITLAANGAETFNYESSTGAPVATYPRLNTYCAEVTVVSDGANWQCINERLGQVPECRVYLSTNQLNLTKSTWTLVLYDTESYDIGSNFNTTTHKFIVPIPGKYQIIDVLCWYGASVVATKNYTTQYRIGASAQQTHTAHSSLVANVVNSLLDVAILAIADEITIWAVNDSGVDTVDIDCDTYYPLIIKLISKS